MEHGYLILYEVYWHELSALQSVTVRRSTGNNTSGPLFSPLFSIFSTFFSSSQPFLIEEVLGSKNLVSESRREHKNLGVNHFPDPVGHFEAPWWPF